MTSITTSRTNAFQSHAGSIEALLGIGQEQIHMPTGFNPTLVRLRQLSRTAMISKLFSFQSHAGSIEAQIIQVLQPALDGVSIPRWFD